MTGAVADGKRRYDVGPAILMVLLMATMSWSVAVGPHVPLLQESVPSYVQHDNAVLNDTAINSSAPNNIYSSRDEVMIWYSADFDFDSRGLFQFNISDTAGNPLNPSFPVSSAHLVLRCSIISGFGTSVGKTVFYASTLYANHSLATATWNVTGLGTNWSAPGANGAGESGDWEPPYSTTSSTVSTAINVTALIQEQLRSGSSQITLAVTSVGDPVNCATKEATTASDRPILRVNYASIGSTSQGGVTLTSPVMNEALTQSNVLGLTADSTPTIEWADLNGNNVEVQISNGSDYRVASDGSWVWNSWNDASAFTFTNSTIGTFETPSSSSIPSGSDFYARIRSATSDSILSDWVSVRFLLPDHDVTTEADGTQSFTVRNNSAGYGGTVEETYITSGNTSFNGGSASNLVVGHSNDSNISESVMLLRINFGEIGLHENASIHEADLVLRRTDRERWPVISVSVLNDNEWTQHGANWTSNGAGSTWSNGARDLVGTSFGGVNGNQTSPQLTFDLVPLIRDRLLANSLEPLNLLVQGVGPNGAHVEIGSSEEAIEYNPRLEIRYSWGDSVLPSSPVDLSPRDRSGSWSITGANLSSSDTIAVNWNTTGHSGHDVKISTSRDADFRSTVTRTADSRYDAGFDLNAGSFTFPSSWGLGIDDKIWWRISFIEDGDHSNWSESMLFVPELNSTYLGGDDHQIRLSDGNASTDGSMPDCQDTYIDSASPNSNYDGYGIIVSNTQVGLIKCDLGGISLPEGMAIESAILRTHSWSFSSFTNVPISVYAGTSEWTETGATWNTTDGSTPWNFQGASGTHRISLLDSNTVSNAGSNTWFDWNVTAAAQTANRWGLPLSIIMTSTSSNYAEFQDFESSNKPELVIQYGIGDDTAPDTPVGLSPTGDEWMASDDLLMSGILRPNHTWNTPLLNTNGVEVQIDTDNGMNSNDLLTYQSWVDTSAFDLVNGIFQPPADLTAGERYFWRIRGNSATGQIGNWSAISSYFVPDVISSMLDSDTSEVEFHHVGFLPGEDRPYFYDVGIDERSANENTSYNSDTSFLMKAVEDLNGNYSEDRGLMIAIPIAENISLERPNDIRVVGAQLHLNVISGHGNDVFVLHRSMGSFTEDATGRTSDGTTNWTNRHLLGNGEMYGINLDEGYSVPASSTGNIVLNLTRAAQLAFDAGQSHIYYAITAIGPNSGWNGLEISTVNSSVATDRPYLALQFREGSESMPNLSAIGLPNIPANDTLTWDTSGIVLDPQNRPTLEWTTPQGWNNTWDWRLELKCETSIGVTTVLYDSRTDSGFTLSVPSFTIQADIASDSSCEWKVQAVLNDMLGQWIDWSNSFGVPVDITSAVDSNHEVITLQEGAAHDSLSRDILASDTRILASSPNTNYGYSTDLYVDPHGSGAALVSIDLTAFPIPEPWMPSSAMMDLYKLNSGSPTEVAVFIVRDNWDETTATWNNASNAATWSTYPGYYTRSMTPLDVTIINSTTGWYNWDVTEAAQQARADGSDVLNLMFVGTGNTVSQFASSDYMSDTLRPRVRMTYTSGTIWIPDDSPPTFPALNNEHTFWNSTALLPTPSDSVDIKWQNSQNNVSFEIQVDSLEDYFTGAQVFNSVDNSSMFTISSSSTTPSIFSFPSTSSWDDNYYAWRVRPYATTSGGDTVYGNWTSGGQFRVPTSTLGTSDGSGNYSITLQRGEVFPTSDFRIPSFPDTWIDSAGGPGQTQNHGTDTSLDVGSSATPGAVAVTLIEMDLGELPFQSTTLPTGVTLKLYRANYIGSGTHTVGIHDCGNNTWGESTVSWSSYVPGQQCSTTASASITRVATGSGTWYEWDITSIARNAFTNQNGRMTMALISNWTGTLYFASSEYTSTTLRPELVFDFVDNPNGITPPPQVSLQSPLNLAVLIEEDGYLLAPQARPDFQWAPATGATGYIVRLMNASTTLTVRSWVDSGFSSNSTTYTWAPSFDLDPDVLYSWDVQSIAGSIPGARSASWSFAVGDPDTESVGNNIYNVNYVQGDAADLLDYPDIHDSSLDESDPTGTYGYDALRVGIGCGDSSGIQTQNECISILRVDLSQYPLPSGVNPHSGLLSIHLDSITIADTSYMDVTAYALINQNYDEISSSWDSSSYGNSWSSSGLVAGTDYNATPLDTVRIYNTNQNTWFEWDISEAMNSMYTSIGIVLIGVPDTTGGRIVAEFDHSEGTSSDRPNFVLNYTDVFDIAISGPSTTDADSPVSFSAALSDASGGALSGSVTWSTSGLGSISSTGLYTPQISGVETITARFGQVIRSISLTVSPGAPVQLQANLSSGAINADESLEISAVVVDVFGNEVDGQTVLWSVTNGTFSSTGGMAETTSTPNAQVVYLPHLTGTQTITVSWGSNSVDIPVVVTVGAPHHLVISGCEIVLAGEICVYSWTVEDIRDNPMPALQAGTVSWSVDDGNISAQGDFSADRVGNWTVTASSSVGVSGSFDVEVIYGAISHVILVADTNEITADGEVTFNITRVDVRGNTHPVHPPIANWSANNGSFNEFGERVSWTPWSKGQQWIQVTVEGVTDQVVISVQDGAPVELDIRVTGGVSEITAGDILSLSAFAIDQRGNQRPVAPETWLISTPGANQEWIVASGASANFYASTAGQFTIQAALTWTDGVQSIPLTSSEPLTVIPGVLAEVEIQGVTEYQVTADDSITLDVIARDAYGNVVPASALKWFIHDTSVSNAPGECGQSQDSSEVTNVVSSGSWAAGVEGSYVLCAIQNGWQDRIDVTVTHGVAVEIWHDAESDELTAGELIDIDLWARDSAGNEFRFAESTWTSPLFVVDDDDTGVYRYQGTVADTHELTYSHNGLDGSWTVTVNYAELDSIDLSLSSQEAEQQATITASARGFDAFGNEVPLSNGAILIAPGHDIQATSVDTWQITLVADGTVAITVADQGKSDEKPLTSVGTLSGFFAAGGPLYYVAAGLIGLVVIALLGVVFALLRRGNSNDYDFDDDDDDYEYDDDDGDDEAPEGPAAGPTTGPVSGPANAPEPEVEESTDDGVTVDEDGTEWWEDEDGTWYFRTPDMDDWEVFEE